MNHLKSLINIISFGRLLDDSGCDKKELSGIGRSSKVHQSKSSGNPWISKFCLSFHSVQNIFFVFTLFLSLFILVTDRSKSDNAQLSNTLNYYRQRNAKTLYEINALKRSNYLITFNDRFVETQARNNLNYGNKDDLIVNFDD